MFYLQKKKNLSEIDVPVELMVTSYMNSLNYLEKEVLRKLSEVCSQYFKSEYKIGTCWKN